MASEQKGGLSAVWKEIFSGGQKPRSRTQPVSQGGRVREKRTTDRLLGTQNLPCTTIPHRCSGKKPRRGKGPQNTMHVCRSKIPPVFVTKKKKPQQQGGRRRRNRSPVIDSKRSSAQPWGVEETVSRRNKILNEHEGPTRERKKKKTRVKQGNHTIPSFYCQNVPKKKRKEEGQIKRKQKEGESSDPLIELH